ncbi:hypothetical protein BC567DRAFT_67150 [Phyllosticta citribraziliensis]
MQIHSYADATSFIQFSSHRDIINKVKATQRARCGMIKRNTGNFEQGAENVGRRTLPVGLARVTPLRKSIHAACFFCGRARSLSAHLFQAHVTSTSSSELPGKDMDAQNHEDAGKGHLSRRGQGGDLGKDPPKQRRRGRNSKDMDQNAAKLPRNRKIGSDAARIWPWRQGKGWRRQTTPPRHRDLLQSP